MSEFFKLNLQLFGEGGDGAPAGDGTEASGEDIPSSIPARARETYRKAAKATANVVETDTPSQETVEAPQKMSYADLIKSDDYKEEHKAYMEKTIGERLKKYKGLEERQSKSDELLSIMAQRYGIDSTSDTFLDDLKSKVDEDDSIYEQYAMDHDMTTSEARRIAELERKVAQDDFRRKAEEQARQEEEQRAANMERWNRLQMNAQQTKSRFPEFNLENELKDERFARICATNNDDTTAAYMACHWNEVINNTAQYASQQAQIQTANSIASGKNRPAENGLSSAPATVVERDFSKMNKSELAAWAAEQRRLKAR